MRKVIDIMADASRSGFPVRGGDVRVTDLIYGSKASDSGMFHGEYTQGVVRTSNASARRGDDGTEGPPWQEELRRTSMSRRRVDVVGTFEAWGRWCRR